MPTFTLFFSHPLTLLYVILYFLLLLCVWASCCMCWWASRLPSPWNEQRRDLNSLSHGEGTVGYLSFPWLPASTKLVGTSYLWDIYSSQSNVLKINPHVQKWGRKKRIWTYSWAGHIPLKTRLIICFLSTVKPGNISGIGVLTKASHTLFLVQFVVIPLFEEYRSYTHIYKLNQQKHNGFFLGVQTKQVPHMFPFLFSSILQDRYLHIFTFYPLGLLFFFFFPSLGIPQFVMPWNTSINSLLESANTWWRELPALFAIKRVLMGSRGVPQ